MVPVQTASAASSRRTRPCVVVSIESVFVEIPVLDD
jgi:hypothetical protein